MREVVEFLRDALYDLQAVYLFGSTVKNRGTAESDLDIAVLLPSARRLPIELSFALSDVAQKPVDLINLRQASTVLQKEVIFTGKILWAKNDTDVDLFEIFVMGSYQRLNEERAEILAQGFANGRFYHA